MKRARCWSIGVLLASSLLAHRSSFARADSGAVRLSEEKGKYRVTVFTSPTPVRVGLVDISVLVQDAATGEPASGVRVTIKVERRASPGVVEERPATSEAATNKLYRAAMFELPAPGWYSVEVSVAGALGEAHGHFELEAAEPLPSWLGVVPWVGWPFLVVLLFAVHQFLKSSRS
jgi:hypothetical protein